MNAMLRLLPTLAVLSAVTAQEEATTLTALLARADAIALATAVAVETPLPAWQRATFATATVLRGSPGPTVALLEPEGQCCGRALTAVTAGSTWLLFLERRGPAWHALGADRGVVPHDPELLQHVRQLLATDHDPGARARLLAQALMSNSGRVRHDAALALSTLPMLPLDGALHDRVLAALREQLPAPTTSLPALATAAVRTAPAMAATTLVPLYLECSNDDAANALGAALRTLPAPTLAAAVAVTIKTDDLGWVRALDLLTSRADAGHVPLLDQLLAAARTPRQQLAATEALLAHGRDAAALQHEVPSAVLQLALRRRAAGRPFRAVGQGTTR